jgi:hypothetical protein
MSANNARRHRSGEAEVANLGRRHTQKVLSLISLRERLAIAASEYDAHDLDEADDTLVQVWEIEAAIRDIAPGIYEPRWPRWAERDAELMHTPERPHAECSICKMLTVPLQLLMRSRRGRVG